MDDDGRYRKNTGRIHGSMMCRMTVMVMMDELDEVMHSVNRDNCVHLWMHSRSLPHYCDDSQAVTFFCMISG